MQSLQQPNTSSCPTTTPITCSGWNCSAKGAPPQRVQFQAAIPEALQ
jgi:hypothetical protein